MAMMPVGTGLADLSQLHAGDRHDLLQAQLRHPSPEECSHLGGELRLQVEQPPAHRPQVHEAHPAGQQLPEGLGGTELDPRLGNEAMEEQRVRKHLHLQEHHRQSGVVLRREQHAIQPLAEDVVEPAVRSHRSTRRQADHGPAPITIRPAAPAARP
jgi:hypothetical protein